MGKGSFSCFRMSTSSPSPPTSLTARQERVLRELEGVARLLDRAFPLPGGLALGLDTIAGLLPGGDFLAAGASLYLIAKARSIGVPPAVLQRMLGNLALDLVVGLVPVAGDVFDFFYKSNARNLNLARESLGLPPLEFGEEDLAARRSAQRSSGDQGAAAEELLLTLDLSGKDRPLTAYTGVVRSVVRSEQASVPKLEFWLVTREGREINVWLSDPHLRIQDGDLATAVFLRSRRRDELAGFCHHADGDDRTLLPTRQLFTVSSQRVGISTGAGLLCAGFSALVGAIFSASTEGAVFGFSLGAVSVYGLLTGIALTRARRRLRQALTQIYRRTAKLSDDGSSS